MYYVITQAWSNRIIVPMNEATTVAIKQLFGDKAQLVEEYYVQNEGSAFEQIPNKTIIEVWSKDKVDEYIDRGLANPRSK